MKKGRKNLVNQKGRKNLKIEKKQKIRKKYGGVRKRANAKASEER